MGRVLYIVKYFSFAKPWAGEDPLRVPREQPDAVFVTLSVENK